MKKLAIHIGADAAGQVRTMLDRQNMTDLAASQLTVPGGAIGCLGGGALPTQGNVCFFTGSPIHGPGLCALTDAPSAARLLPTWDGAYTGVFWDAERAVLVIVTDALGMQPLYVREADGALTLVSETKAVRGDPDLAAWGAFISIGRPIGERSLVAGLKRVPPASVLTYDCARRRLAIRRYWDWPEPSDAWRGYDFLAAMERDMRAYAAFGDPGTLLLSGGYDSRLLAFLLRRAGIPAHALIVAHEDEFNDVDGRLAEGVARLAGLPYRKVCADPDFVSSAAFLAYLRASDVGYPSLDLFIAKVAAQIPGGALWEGLTGFLFRGNYQPPGGFAAFLPRRIHGPDSRVWRVARAVFKPEVARAMRAGFDADLRAELARLPRDAYGLARFVIEDRVRNRPAMNPLKVYANRAQAFTPGLSKDFLAHALIIPPAVKWHTRFYRDLFARLDKRALSLPFLSGGELISSGGIRPAYWREWLRVRTDKYRVRHPRAFPGLPRHPPALSAFLDERLLADTDPYLAPGLRTRLTRVDAGNYDEWKLLFHWKAWQWVHAGRLRAMLGGAADA